MNPARDAAREAIIRLRATEDTPEIWAWENMLYGGAIRWQLHCRWGIESGLSLAIPQVAAE